MQSLPGLSTLFCHFCTRRSIEFPKSSTLSSACRESITLSIDSRYHCDFLKFSATHNFRARARAKVFGVPTYKLCRTLQTCALQLHEGAALIEDVFARAPRGTKHAGKLSLASVRRAMADMADTSPHDSWTAIAAVFNDVQQGHTALKASVAAAAERTEEASRPVVHAPAWAGAHAVCTHEGTQPTGCWTIEAPVLLFSNPLYVRTLRRPCMDEQSARPSAIDCHLGCLHELYDLFCI